MREAQSGSTYCKYFVILYVDKEMQYEYVQKQVLGQNTAELNQDHSMAVERYTYARCGNCNEILAERIQPGMSKCVDYGLSISVYVLSVCELLPAFT
jgi:hypothetical protein